MVIFEFILYNKYDFILFRRIWFIEYYLIINFKYLSEKCYLIWVVFKYLKKIFMIVKRVWFFVKKNMFIFSGNDVM